MANTPPPDAPAPRPRRRGIYVLPNLFTTLGLFAGFYAIVAAGRGQFGAACLAVFASILADGLDGRVARLTGTETDFGAEYDSLSDMVAFGVAPALLIYDWALQNLGKAGWLLAFFYAAAAALRLARFNTQPQVYGKQYFQGLPSPAAAALVTSAVWAGHNFDFPAWVGTPLALLVTAGGGALMVSNLRYYSFKEVDPRGRIPFFAAVLIAVGVAVVFTNPPVVLLSLFSAYAVSGPILTLTRRRHWRRRSRASAPD
ncbi:MAG TPA: CDP-diacylglycerol--serine O-phosphatidyltransferase [Gammaproteobacteria bacterium]|jgi:CDP-diacylglycerol--serine O-phosphatidyltransferase|uniref:CDP-diacylglycerol--serine O-phosphatidyltransferase n=1 Tax=Immundisolibacter sp. TaxID=1934948 RepID=UPI000E80B8E3|nr:CDP-diacylglycerol--serine O-phosphatidyltransferase [Gammaproteobacteria bacterium]HCZ49585.1 CDP-diacylglycerol--serine O-phosphatidyltransferase [Gammaproteobacteria bacterium]MCH79023.1 CDP-diacylglycerol--serine O-phosphatidyltransferase [Gammaproteobacteria bacterium]